jgi:p-aminobenzoyl-glutamate transporter AbgT
MRGFLIGLVLVVLLGTTVLSLRPGGLRRQMRYAARRFRLAIVLAAVYVVCSAVMRIAFSDSAVTDWGLPALAIALAILFLVLGQNPREPATPGGPSRS